MNRLALVILTSFALLAPIRDTWPQTAPPGVNPEVPPGTETPQGDILLQGDAPQPLIPEIQPGTETPRTGETGMVPGTGPLPGTLNSGDEDDIEDLEVERLTVNGGILPDATGANPASASPGSTVLQSGGGDGTQTEDELYVGRKATGLLPETPAPEIQPGTETPRAGDTGMAPGTTVLQPGGGDGTQTEDELYVGRKATGLLPETPAPEIQPGTETPRAGDTGMALGTGPLPGTRNSGDEDEFEDLDIERHTVQGGGLLQDAPGLNPASVSPGIPGQPASGGLDLPAVGMKPKDAGGAGGGEPQPAPKTTKSPTFRAGKDAKDGISLTGEPTRRENCGTVLTGLIDDPDADVNPCPMGCERGEQLWVKTYKSGDTTQYEASYQCYMPAVPTLSMPADAPSSGENCGTYWTGWMETLDVGVNPCPQGCLRGQKPTVKTGLSGHGIKYDVNYQCYMPEIPTLSMPADAPSSGENCGTYWTGWMDTLDAGVNPCPQNCVRGQKPTVKTGLSDHGIKYDVNYQCYTATTTMAADARAPKPIVDPAAAPQQVSSIPAGKLIPASGPWGEFVRVEGARFGSAETVRGMWFPADDTTQPPSMSQTVTLRAHDGADAIEVQIPADPLTSGWSGDYTKGALRLLLIMPDESVIYAGQYTIDSGDARTNLRQAVRPDISTTSSAQQTPTASERETTPVLPALVTAPLQMTGKRLAAIDTLSVREISPAPVSVLTPSLQMTGKRVTFVDTSSGRAVAVLTPELRMTGKRLTAIGGLSVREIAPAPVSVLTPSLQMTGIRVTFTGTVTDQAIAVVTPELRMTGKRPPTRLRRPSRNN